MNWKRIVWIKSQKSRLSLEIIQHKSAPLLPAVAMEISPTIFGWIQHSSWGDMWRMRMCLCEWLCACVGASIYIYVCDCQEMCTVCPVFLSYVGCHSSLLEEGLIDNTNSHFKAWIADNLRPHCPRMSQESLVLSHFTSLSVPHF